MSLIRRQRERSAALGHRYVDMWAFPGVHPTNLEIVKRLKTADDRQFGTHMDVCGTVSEKDSNQNWQRTHLVGLRTDVWHPDGDRRERALEELQVERQAWLRSQFPASSQSSQRQRLEFEKLAKQDRVLKLEPNDLEIRRLVLKLFRDTGERVSWAGSLEEVPTREVPNSVGSRRAVLSFSSAVAQSRYLTAIQENHRTFRWPAIFTCFYCDESTGRLWYLSIKRKWISIGADFVIESEGRVVARIDGALFGLGYNAHVDVDEPELAQDRQFLDILSLFAASVGYHRAIRRALKRRLANARIGVKGKLLVDDEELSLWKNPRAA